MQEADLELFPWSILEAFIADPKSGDGLVPGLENRGTDLPNVFRAGLFWQEGNKVFWTFATRKKTIVWSWRMNGLES